jgi:VWFA-related protein
VRRTLSLGLGGLLFVVIAAIAAAQSASTDRANSSSTPPSAPARQSAPSTPSTQPPSQPSTLQVATRLVTIDVVATNSHGVVGDLKADDFELTDGTRQKIEKFAFIDKSTAAAAAKSAAEPARPKGFYTNQAVLQSLRIPPTVVLMDSLNSNIQNLVQTRHHMIGLLKTLPADTPVAVFLLGQSLRVVQNFTSDPALLRAAVDKTMSPSPDQPPMPQDDPNSLSLAVFDANDEQESDVSQQLEDFEKESYAQQMDIRVQTTLDALRAIAHYLGGYEGRKNLIWVSESFPITLWPDADFGTNTGVFKGARDYGEQLADVSNALSDANVAVYPVDAKGLDAGQVFSAEQNNVARPNSRSRNLAAQLNRENNARIAAQQTMDSIAQDSGGKTCKNTNDLSGCIEGALNDSSSFYELAYYPQDVKWDGTFRKIVLKTTRSGVKLSYRRGYFAQDIQAIAKNVPPEKRLEQSCTDFLPSTAIPITAQVVAADQPDSIKFRVSIAPSGLSFAPDGQSYKLNAFMAACAYNADGTSFRFFPKDLTQSVSADAYKDLQANGFTGMMNFPKSGIGRLRIAVLDETSGTSGALDVPVSSPEFLEVAKSLAPPPPEPVNPEPQGTTIGFKVPSGKSGTLDWSGDKLVYRGDLSSEQSAPAFFAQFYFNNGFHCASGALTPTDARTPAPSLRLTFVKPDGQTSIVDLKGDHPDYSGTLPVDDSAKPFFERLWYLMHCTSPPR